MKSVCERDRDRGCGERRECVRETEIEGVCEVRDRVCVRETEIEEDDRDRECVRETEIDSGERQR